MASVTVRYWAGAARAAGVPSEVCDVVTLTDLRRHLAQQESMAKLSTVASLLVDGAQCAEDADLPDGVVVDVLPPFAGGSGS